MTADTTPTGSNPPSSAPGNLAAISNVVVLMLENRSFDHMLGYLYAAQGNVAPSGQSFEGLTGNESCPDGSGRQVSVFPITPSTPDAYFMPGADPGEGYKATNDQLWGSDTAPASGTLPTMAGFVKDYAYTIGWEKTRAVTSRPRRPACRSVFWRRAVPGWHRGSSGGRSPR